MSTFTFSVKLKAHHPYYLTNFVKKLKPQVSAILNAHAREVFLPHKVERFTILRSPHVDKKARDQFERISYRRLIIIEGLKTELTFLKMKQLVGSMKTAALGLELTIQTTNNV